MKSLLRRIHYLLNRRRLDRELADEMAFHREMAAKSGGAPLGDDLRLREDSREAWGWTWIDRLGQDLRYSYRSMKASPGFTAAAVLVLAIGIGATVAAFSTFNMLVLRPLPVPEPESLLRFQRQGQNQYWTDVPFPAVAFYAEQTRTLSAVLALSTGRLAFDEEEDSPTAYFVTANFFTELGGAAALGRLFDRGDETASAERKVVLGHAFWVSRFGSDETVVGRSIRLNGQPTTVIGVASPRFSGFGSDTPEFWALINQHPLFIHGSQMLTDFTGSQNSGVNMWGRLRAGVTPRVAEDELAQLAVELRKQHPDDVWEGERLASEPGGFAQSVGSTSRGSGPPQSIRSKLYPTFGLIGALVLLILAVACGNLGSLLLARGALRGREMSLRMAVGAGAGRLIRQLFTESLILAGLGTLGGIALAMILLKVTMAMTEAPPWFDATPDLRVLAFAVAVGILSAVLFGLAPALHIARQRSQMSFGRTFLIGAQVASSCVLLIVAGLLVRAFDLAVSSDPGFEYEHALVIRPALSEHGYTPERARVYLDDLRGRLRAMPGVEAVTLTSTPPMGGARMMSRIDHNGESIDVYIHQVDPEFLDTMKIKLMRGRNLTAGDEQGVVVSESLARRRWPDEDPLGKPFELDGATPFTVVGVARSARSMALNDPDAVEMYRLARATDLPGVSVVVRTSGAPDALSPALVASAKSIDPNFTPRVQLLKNVFRQRLRDVQQSALAVSLLGVTALLVACLGIIGLVGYSVSQRTKEIGIRIALGADAVHVLKTVAQQFQRTVLAGLVAGVFGAAALSQLLRRELYGLSTIDPVSYLAAVALFIFAATLAALIPARLALRVDPLIALRCD